MQTRTYPLIYNKFAEVYDTFMKEMPYPEWIDYLEDLLAKSGKNDKEIVDIACGTGTMLIELARRGYKCTGIDISPEMTKIARRKSKDTNLKINFLVQDMRKLKLDRKVPVAVCMYDSINYLLKKTEIADFFRNVYRILEKDGIFIFDMNTEYGLNHIWGTKTKYFETKNLAVISKTHYSPKEKIALMDMNFFLKKNKKYKNFQEQHIEKVYSVSEIKNILTRQGFRNIVIYKDRTFDKPDRQTARVWFKAIKDK